MARLTDNLLVETVVGRQGVVVDVDVKNKAAGLLAVAHDNSMDGNGTPDDPLRVNTDVIATKEDYIQADSEIHQILNAHASELITIRNNQGALGNQVANIESKIPETASGNNPLITKQQLLEEEADIREDLNSGLSEVQTQITAQATAIAGIQDEIGNISLMLDSINGEIV